MAVRRPAWDLSFSEIQRRADAAKVDSYFARQRQADAARAESATAASRAADQEIRAQLAQAMSPDAVIAFSDAVRRGENPDIASYMTARADAVETGDGLRMITKFDDSNRPIRTFENTGPRKRWMDRFKSEPMEMLRICKTPQTIAQNARFESKWRAARAMVASGKITLPSLDT